MVCAKSQIVVSAEELCGFLFDGNFTGGEHLSVLYHAYIDDSADGERKRIVVAGAIIGEPLVWQNLGKLWKERLDQDSLDYFKSSQCKSLRGQFHKFRDLGMAEGRRRADKVEADLDNLIKTSRVTCLGVTLSVPFHQSMLADPARFGEIPSVPYRLAFQQVLAECAKAMMLLGRDRIVTFGHDDGGDFPILRKLYSEFKKRNPRYAKVMLDFVPLDDKVHAPVQAADVAASVTCKSALNSMDNPAETNVKRLRERMYKIVNWLDNPASPLRKLSADELPAKAFYAQ